MRTLLVALVLIALTLPAVAGAQNGGPTPTPCQGCMTATPTPSRTPTATATAAPTQTGTPGAGTEYGLQILGGPSGPEATAVAALHPTWIRARVFWTPQMQGYGWSDAVVNYAESVGAKLILEWWAWNNSTGPGADCSTVTTSAHAILAGNLAARYGDRVDAWEIDNETDDYRCGLASSRAYRYNAVRAAIIAQDSDAVVLPGGFAYDYYSCYDKPAGYQGCGGPYRYSFPDQLYDRLTPAPPGPLAVHHYAYWEFNWTMGGKIANLRSRTGYTGPVWVTETGEQSAVYGEAWQATRLRALMEQCDTYDVPVCVVFQAADDGPTWGLYTSGGARKLAADVYATEAAE